jgi:hypothetical protein
LIVRLAAGVLIVLATGCAVSVAPPGGRSAETAGLAGTWRGTFWQANAGDSGYLHGDIELQVKEDGTYTGIWATRLVAGSTRASRSEISGTISVDGNRVTLRDWRRLMLRRAGDVLYGITMDSGSGRTLSLRLEKVRESR